MKPRRPIDLHEREIIRAYYEHTPAEQFELADLAASLGRAKSTVARVAGELGLTSAFRPRTSRAKALMSEATKRQLAERGHPRGFAGKRHRDDTLAIIGRTSKAAWARAKETGAGLMSPERLRALSDAATREQESRNPSFNRRHWRAGPRADLGGAFFRSSWEANFARYLEALRLLGEIDRWDYEPCRFTFEEPSVGVRSYRPDFRVWGGEAVFYVELKGWVCERTKRVWRLMEAHYPDVDLRFLDGHAYRSLEREVSAFIPAWERTDRRATLVQRRAA